MKANDSVICESIILYAYTAFGRYRHFYYSEDLFLTPPSYSNYAYQQAKNRIIDTGQKK